MRPLEIEEIKSIITNSSKSTQIMIGCDSQKGRGRRHKGTVQYIRVVVIHVDGNRGCMVFGDSQRERDYGNLKQRLMQEVYLATGLAYELVEVIGDRKMSIHLDINQDPVHKSQIAMKEAVGFVRGMLGVDPVLKPDAIAASTCADYYAKG